jgi:hypothetical protein
MAGVDIKPDNKDEDNGYADGQSQTYLFPEKAAFEKFLDAHRVTEY